MNASMRKREMGGADLVPVLLALVATMLAGVLPARADVTVWDQPSDLGNAYASQFDPNGNGSFATAYDNFNLSQATSITNVSWVGSYYNPPIVGPISSFEVQFWSDAAGQPGVSLADYVFPGNASESSLGNDNNGSPAFAYSVGLGTAFDAAAGTQYWLSFVPTIGFPPQWMWETGTGGDGMAYQDFFGTRSPLASDLAFSLQGVPGVSPVPEPASVSLLGLGLISSALVAWRRRRSKTTM